MKLITKTILYYLLVCIPILCVVGMIAYHQIKETVRDSTDEGMWEEKRTAERLIDANRAPSDTINFNAESFIVLDSVGKTGFEFKEITKMNSENELAPFRILDAYHKWRGKNYWIRIVKPTMEEEDLVESLTTILFIILGGLILAFFLVNWLVSKTLWKPFYNTLGKLDNFNIKNASTEFEISSTKEFAQLSRTLDKMTKKLHSDFLNQKEFTENASHEMQTPLAIIKTKLELLMQSPNLSENDMSQLQAVDSSVNKLSSLNKSLLLLAKIENMQFKDVSEVNVAQVIDKVVSNYEDLLLNKKIKVNKLIKQELKLKMNAGLCDILITNLLQNAIRHNMYGGTISIEVNENGFSMANAGEALTIAPEELFVRFKKNDASKESLGLGLSIVKGICDVCGLGINYSFQNNLHTFTLNTKH